MNVTGESVLSTLALAQNMKNRHFQDTYEDTYSSSSDIDHAENHDKFVYYAMNDCTEE